MINVSIKFDGSYLYQKHVISFRRMNFFSSCTNVKQQLLKSLWHQHQNFQFHCVLPMFCVPRVLVRAATFPTNTFQQIFTFFQIIQPWSCWLNQWKKYPSLRWISPLFPSKPADLVACLNWSFRKSQTCFYMLGCMWKLWVFDLPMGQKVRTFVNHGEGIVHREYTPPLQS